MRQRHLRTVTLRRAQAIDITFENLPGLLIWIGSMVWFIKEW